VRLAEDPRGVGRLGGAPKWLFASLTSRHS